MGAVVGVGVALTLGASLSPAHGQQRAPDDEEEHADAAHSAVRWASDVALLVIATQVLVVAVLMALLVGFLARKRQIAVLRAKGASLAGFPTLDCRGAGLGLN